MSNCLKGLSPLDELDGPEGLVHVADSQVEAEVEHGVSRALLTALQAHKVPHGPPGHHVGGLAGRRRGGLLRLPLAALSGLGGTIRLLLLKT